MDRILHDVDNAHKILQLTSDTLILVDKNGTCLDIDPHSDLWFLQEDRLLGKNLFNLLPDHTFQKLLPDFVAGDPTGDNGEPQLPAATGRGRNVLLQMYHAAVRR